MRLVMRRAQPHPAPHVDNGAPDASSSRLPAGMTRRPCERPREVRAGRCGLARKVEPTQRALAGLDAWIAGLRRDQGGDTRAHIQILERYDRDDGSPLVKVHPLASWTRSDTWRYVLQNEVPYNPLLDQGYKSIGCWPCTRPVDAEADERAGRWGGRKAECGIHTFLPRRDG